MSIFTNYSQSTFPGIYQNSIDFSAKTGYFSSILGDDYQGQRFVEIYSEQQLAEADAVSVNLSKNDYMGGINLYVPTYFFKSFSLEIYNYTCNTTAVGTGAGEIAANYAAAGDTNLRFSVISPTIKTTSINKFDSIGFDFLSQKLESSYLAAANGSGYYDLKEDFVSGIENSGVVVAGHRSYNSNASILGTPSSSTTTKKIGAGSGDRNATVSLPSNNSILRVTDNDDWAITNPDYAGFTTLTFSRAQNKINVFTKAMCDDQGYRNVNFTFNDTGCFNSGFLVQMGPIWKEYSSGSNITGGYYGNFKFWLRGEI
jgi:hypothetical protein